LDAGFLQIDSRAIEPETHAQEEHSVDTAYLTATAALAGSAIGGLTSFLSTWLSKGVQLNVQLLVHDKLRRQELYREFIDHAAKVYVDGMTCNTPDLPTAVNLYALISRMRILSTTPVIDEAEKVASLVVDAYPLPNRTLGELHDMVREHAFDPLRGFSEACRKEVTAPYTP
jgi:hypothetical protein